MAQVKKSSMRRLARRYGVRTGVAAAACLALVLVAFACVGLFWGGSPKVTLDRGGDGEGDVETRVEEVEGGAEGASDTASPEPSPDEGAKTLVVHVDGAVENPGVYELDPGARVADAVLSAGGLAEGADTSSVNLASLLSDGQKVHVPIEGEPVSGVSGGGAEAGEGALVNLNLATVEELDGLPGIGEATARAIVEDREQNGPFGSPEDLMRVSGIGEKKFAKLEAMICV